MKNVIVGDRGEETGLGYAQLLNQADVGSGSADPGCGLDGSSAGVSLLYRLQSLQVVRSVDKEFRLPDGTGFSGKLTEDVVDRHALFGGEREASLLAVAMGGFGRPGLGRQIGG